MNTFILIGMANYDLWFWNCNDKKSSKSVFIEKYLGKAHHEQWNVIVFVAIF